MKAEVTKVGLLDLQVCVPSEWTDKQVEEFAEEENPSGTNGWAIRREGDKALAGDPERQSCEGRFDCVHIMLDA